MRTLPSGALNRLRAFPRFLTGDELSRRLTALHDADLDRTRLQTIGRSRSGQSLKMISMGSGDRHAVLLGFPHPNEPTGALAQVRMIELFLADAELLAATGIQWHFLPNMDPDGARLNEAWFGGPFTRQIYAQGLYRPPFAEQFEWTFNRPELPDPGLEPLPESRAAMQVIDTLRPDLVVSMHNGEVGGTYCYVTRPVRSLPGHLHTVRRSAGLPYELGEPEAHAEPLSPGIFLAPPNLTGGTMLCSTDYAAKYGALGITSEPPLWASPEAEDTSAAVSAREEIHRDLRTQWVKLRHVHQGWVEKVAAIRHLDGPRGRAIRADAESLGHTWPHEPASGASDKVTVAYEASLRRGLDLERLRTAGHVIAFIDEAQKVGPLDHALLAVRADTTKAVEAWCAESASPTARFVGVAGAVRQHVGTALAGAAALETITQQARWWRG